MVTTYVMFLLGPVVVFECNGYHQELHVLTRSFPTRRSSDLLAQLDGTPDLIVNLQGDAPLTPHWFLEELIAAMRERQDVAVATPVLRCDQQTYTHFKDDRAVGRVGGTTAV